MPRARREVPRARERRSVSGRQRAQNRRTQRELRDAEASAARQALADAGRAAPRSMRSSLGARAGSSDAFQCLPRAHALGHAAWALTVDAACASPCCSSRWRGSHRVGRARSVLLTQSHLATRTFPLSHPASPCVGDGATAILVTASELPGIQVTHSVTHGETTTRRVCRDKGSARCPVGTRRRILHG